MTTFLDGTSPKVALRKAGYLLAISAGWGITASAIRGLINAYIRHACPLGCDDKSASSYGLLAGGAQMILAIGFIAWVRHVRRAEGGKAGSRVAAVILTAILGMFAAALLVSR